MPGAAIVTTLVSAACIAIVIWSVAVELRAATGATHGSPKRTLAVAAVPVLAAACALTTLALALGLD